MEDAEQMAALRRELKQLVLPNSHVAAAVEFASGGPSSDEASNEFVAQLGPILQRALQFGITADLETETYALVDANEKRIATLLDDQKTLTGSSRRTTLATQCSESIRNATEQVTSRLNDTGQRLSQAKQDLAQAKIMKSNLDNSVQAVESCLEVLDLTNRIHGHLADGQKYAALKCLHVLQNVHLKEVSDFGFAQIIERSVPALTKMIRADTAKDIAKWISGAQSLAEEIGQTAFERTTKMRSIWRKYSRHDPMLSKQPFNSPVELAFRDDTSVYGNYCEPVELPIDFGPLYECVLVQRSMEDFSEFRKHFEIDRSNQLKTLIPQAMVLQDLEATNSVLRQIVGFFSVEREICRKLPKLQQLSQVTKSWESIMEELSTTITNGLVQITEVKEIIGLKGILSTFLHTTYMLGLPVERHRTLLTSVFRRYSKLLGRDFAKSFVSYLYADDYNPFGVASKESFDTVAKAVYWHRMELDKDMADSQRTLVFPFSKIVYQCGTELRKLIDNHESFMEDLQNESAVVESVLCNTVDDQLANVVCKKYREEVQVSSKREQVVQMYVNLKYFKLMAEQLQIRLQDHRTRSGKKDEITLRSIQLFEEAHKMADSRLSTILNNKVEASLELSEYDWYTKEENVGPSFYLTEVCGFIDATISQAFKVLDHPHKKMLYLNALDFLSSSLLEMLRTAPNHISPAALHNFALDAEYLDKYVRKVSSSVDDITISTVTAKLMQSVELITNGDPMEYNDMRGKKYQQLSPEEAGQLISKVSQFKAPDSPGGPSIPDRHPSHANRMLNNLANRFQRGAS